MASPALIRSPHPDAVDHGLALLDAGRGDDALRILSREARNNRLDANAQHAYGLALHRTWRFSEAVEQFLRADRLLPDRWQVQQNLSAAYHGLGEYEKAYVAARRTLELNPGHVPALYHLADLHLIWGEMEEAVAFYDQVLEADPGHHEAHTGTLFALDLIPGVTPERALSARQRYARTFEAAGQRHRRSHRNAPDPDRQLRIGWLSGDFRDHTAAYMWGPLYEHLDRDQFMIFSYADMEKADELSEWFRQKSNGWRAFQHCPPEQIAQVIRDDEIDVLIDTAGYTNGGHLRVFAMKPAPVQIQAFGYLTGSGLRTMDAILVDDVLVPQEHEAHFTEQCVRVPYALGFSGLNGDVPITRKPDGAPLTFGHLGRSDKVSRQAVALWASVLRAYPGSRMLVKDRGIRFERTRDRLVRWFAEAGIGPERLDLRGTTPRGEHLATYNEVDVILDSVPQGGGTTTIEALWMGTPVVTMLGPRIIGRIAATTLHAVGHDTWIAEDEDAYVRLAGQVAAEGGSHLRDEIAGSVVFDGKARTRAFEDAVRGLWTSWCEQRKGV